MPRKKKLVHPSCVSAESQSEELVGKIARLPSAWERQTEREGTKTRLPVAARIVGASEQAGGGVGLAAPLRRRAAAARRSGLRGCVFSCGSRVPVGSAGCDVDLPAQLRARPVSATPAFGSSNSRTFSPPGFRCILARWKKAATTEVTLPLSLSPVVVPGGVIRTGS